MIRQVRGGQLTAIALGILLAAESGCLMQGEPVAVPNASFEFPSTLFVSTIIDSWEKPPKPDWYDESGGFFWDQLTGIFLNPAPGDARRKDNCDGEQALWLFAVPEVALFQDLAGPSVPPQSNLVYEIEKSYLLEAGVIGGSGGMMAGVTLELSLYYRDEEGNAVTVAATSVTNSLNAFSNATHFVDFQVQVPPVKHTDPWADRGLGVRLSSTVGLELQGGWWELDNIRLTSAGQPVLTDVSFTNGEIELTLESEPGLQFDLLSTTDPNLPLAEWTPVSTLTNVTGRVSYSEPVTNAGARVYRARQSN